MTWRVLIRASAERDLDDARNWYNGQKPGLGNEFLVSIAEAFTRLEENLERYRLLHRDFRRVLVERFPTGFFFKS